MPQSSLTIRADRQIDLVDAAQHRGPGVFFLGG